MKIRHRAMLLGMLPALLVTLLLGGYLIHARLADLQAGLHARGQAVAGNLAQGALYSVVSGNRAPLEGLLQQTLQHADVVYAAGYRLSVRSRPRRGTLFSLAIPRLAEAPAEAPVEAACMDPSRLRGLVALVDDDRLILDALPPARQLGSGGGGGAGRRGLLARLSRAPDLLITDYRLAGGESGLDMVERVTAVHGPLPVVIVTGDTARDSLAEIAAHGHPVLHKPVHPARLRAALQRLLATSCPA